MLSKKVLMVFICLNKASIPVEDVFANNNHFSEKTSDAWPGIWTIKKKSGCPGGKCHHTFACSYFWGNYTGHVNTLSYPSNLHLQLGPLPVSVFCLLYLAPHSVVYI